MKYCSSVSPLLSTFAGIAFLKKYHFNSFGGDGPTCQQDPADCYSKHEQFPVSAIAGEGARIGALLGHAKKGITGRYATAPDPALVAPADRISTMLAMALDGKEADKVVRLSGTARN